MAALLGSNITVTAEQPFNIDLPEFVTLPDGENESKATPKKISLEIENLDCIEKIKIIPEHEVDADAMQRNNESNTVDWKKAFSDTIRQNTHNWNNSSDRDKVLQLQKYLESVKKIESTTVTKREKPKVGRRRVSRRRTDGDNIMHMESIMEEETLSDTEKKVRLEESAKIHTDLKFFLEKEREHRARLSQNFTNTNSSESSRITPYRRRADSNAHSDLNRQSIRNSIKSNSSISDESSHSGISAKNPRTVKSLPGSEEFGKNERGNFKKVPKEDRSFHSLPTAIKTSEKNDFNEKFRYWHERHVVNWERSTEKDRRIKLQATLNNMKRVDAVNGTLRRRSHNRPSRRRTENDILATSEFSIPQNEKAIEYWNVKRQNFSQAISDQEKLTIPSGWIEPELSQPDEGITDLMKKAVKEKSGTKNKQCDNGAFSFW